jgi:ribosomal protein S21
MITIEVRKGNVSKAIVLLNKKVKEDGTLRLSVERSTFTPKSERKRLKSKRARKYAAKQAAALRSDIET